MIIHALLLTLSLATPAPASPLPDGPLLLQRFVRTIGGETAIRSVKTLSASGRIELPGSPAAGTFSWAVADGNRCTFETSFPDLGSSSFGSDGTIAWEQLVLNDQRVTTALTLEEVEQRRRNANWFELVFTLPARSRAFTTIGQATFDGVPAFEVRMVDSIDRVHHLFFDVESHLLLGVRLLEEGPLGTADISIRFGNWKPVGDLLLFHSVTIHQADISLVLRFDSISIDPVPPARFAAPEGINSAERPADG